MAKNIKGIRLECGGLGSKHYSRLVRTINGKPVKEEKMTTKTEPSNVQIAEALGWECVDKGNKTIGPGRRSALWVMNGIYEERLPTPDFKNDNNASWKYVWPEIKDEIIKNNTYSNLSKTVFSDISLAVLESPNPALYLATAFWKLKKGE